MQPQLQSNVLEHRLAHVLMRELTRIDAPAADPDADDTLVDFVRVDLDLDSEDYVSFEVVYGAAEAPSQDHVTTIKFLREAMDPDTVRYSRYSMPYELVDIRPLPLPPPDDDIVIEIEIELEPAEVDYTLPRSRAWLVGSILVLALALGVGIALFAI